MQDPVYEGAIGGVYDTPAQVVDGVYGPPGPSGSGRAPGAKGSRSRLAVGLATVVAMIATGFGITQVTRADGADTPEAAVEALFQAIGDEDALGVMESLAPEEREVLVPSVRSMAAELQRVEMIDDSLDLGDVSGLEIDVEGLNLRTQGLHPDVASVLITGGTLKTSANFRQLPLGKALSAALEEAAELDLDEGADETAELKEIRLATVRRDGGWHVSLLYTLAEMGRVDAEQPVPDFGNGIPARGTKTPEAAIDAMVAALNADDFVRMIELTPPDTMAVMHDYGRLWLDDQPDDEDDENDEYDDEESTDTFELTYGEPSGSMTERQFPVTGYRWEQSSGGESTWSISYDGTCTTTESSWEMYEDDPSSSEPTSEKFKVCPGDSSGAGGMLGMGSIFGPLAPGAGTMKLTVVQRGGSWFVDPSRSVFDTVVGYLSDVSAVDARNVADYMALMFNDDSYGMWAYAGPEFYEECPGVDPPADDATFAERKKAGEACEEEAGYNDEFEDVGRVEDPDQGEDSEEFEEFGEEISPGEDPEGDWTEEDEWPSEECYESGEPEVIEPCLERLLDAGEIDEQELNEFRCERVYDNLNVSGREPTDEEWEAADEDYESCIAGNSPPPEATPESEPVDPDRGTHSTVLPAPSTTVIPTPTTAG